MRDRQTIFSEAHYLRGAENGLDHGQDWIESVPMPTRKPSAAAPRHWPNAPRTGRRISLPRWIATPSPVMVAGGIAQADIARARGISAVTLRKHYRAELTNGMTALNTIVNIAHIERITAGEFQAIKCWEQSTMGWSERIVVNNGKPADTPVRVPVEFVGEAAAPRFHV